MGETGTGKQQKISRIKGSDLQRKQGSKPSLSPCFLTADTNSAALLSLFSFRMIHSLNFAHDSYRNLTTKPLKRLAVSPQPAEMSGGLRGEKLSQP